MQSRSKLFLINGLKTELENFSGYFFIASSIKNLEKSKSKLVDQVKIIKETQDLLLDGPFAARFENILRTNPGFDFFYQYDDEANDEDLKIFKYAPLNSAWVERSFSSMNLILKDERLSILIENLKMLLFFYFNNKNSYLSVFFHFQYTIY